MDRLGNIFEFIYRVNKCKVSEGENEWIRIKKNGWDFDFALETPKKGEWVILQSNFGEIILNNSDSNRSNNDVECSSVIRKIWSDLTKQTNDVKNK